jgi:hypothetical protein
MARRSDTRYDCVLPRYVEIFLCDKKAPISKTGAPMFRL